MADTVTVLASLAASGALTATLVFLAKSWLSERLKQSIQHEYSERLESFKVQLRAENDIAMEKLKTATNVYLETKKLGHHKILDAIDSLSTCIFTIDDNRPAIFGTLDVLYKNEYSQIFDNPTIQPQIESLSYTQATEIVKETQQLHIHRPYLGEYLWWHFVVYRAIHGRIIFLLTVDRDKGTRKHWIDDALIRQHAESVLDESQINDIFNSARPTIEQLTGCVKTKILKRCAEIISGDASAADGYEIAQKISKIVGADASNNRNA